jgi:hypothetical protein
MQNSMVDAFNNLEKYDTNFPLNVYTKCLTLFLSYFFYYLWKKKKRNNKAILQVLPYSILVQPNLLSIHCIYCKQIVEIPWKVERCHCFSVCCLVFSHIKDSAAVTLLWHYGKEGKSKWDGFITKLFILKGSNENKVISLSIIPFIKLNTLMHTHLRWFFFSSSEKWCLLMQSSVS